MLNLKYHSTDNGNCRVYYTGQFKDQRKRLYCWQLVSRGEFELLTCSKDGEPECPVRSDLTVSTPPAKTAESIGKQLNKYLAALESEQDIVVKLRNACTGHPAAKIPWPHRLLHEAIAEIECLRDELHAQNNAAET